VVSWSVPPNVKCCLAMGWSLCPNCEASARGNFTAYLSMLAGKKELELTKQNKEVHKKDCGYES
jgi:hypothetical protein